jgi:CBS domain-containing protein
MSVGKYCLQAVRTVRPDETARAAAQRMKEEGVGCLVVTEQDRPVGMVTDRDVALRVLRENLDAEKLQVRDVMQSPVVSIATDAPLGEALQRLRRSAVRRLAVVSPEEKIAGLFATDDLLRLLATELGDLAEALRVQLSGAQAKPRGAAGGRVDA